VARPDGRPTAGCLAFALGDLLRIVERLEPGSRVIIEAPAGPARP
jgi:L,D-peptidoglycan transpeptidase YkuD (ErfK/YbiS/YcfS/YnhG family)